MANAISTATFIDTLGVNTHIGVSGAYSNIATVEQDLSYLGVPIVRDSIDSASVIATWQAVAQATGVKFDDFMPEDAPTWDQAALALVPQLAQDRLLAYVEGGNEEDDPYAIANGNSLSWAAQFQQQVFATGQQYDIPVINMSFGQGWTAANNWEGDYPTVGNLSAYTNYANAHTYPNVGQSPSSAIGLLNSDAKLAASSRPVITTEIGWQTSQFSETAIAQYAIDATFDGIVAGDAGMWFYGLYDDASGTWGLFNSDGSARPVATALHDLTTLLADTGANAASFTPGSLNYTVSGSQSGDNSFLMEKSDGSFWIGLWNEGGSQHTVTITLPTPASQIEIFDPVTGTSAIQSASNAGSIAVNLGADPLLVEVIAGSTTTSTGSSSSSGSSNSSTGSGSSTSTSTANTPQDLVVTVPASESTTAGAKLAISGVSITDAWAASTTGSMALNVWDSYGTLTIGGQTFGPGGGPVPYGMFSGSLAQLNADLASLSYTAPSSSTSDTITVDVWNQAGVEVKETIAVKIAAGTSSTSPSTSGSSSGSTTTAPTSSGPVITVPSTENVAVNSTVAVQGVSVSDAFAANNPGVMALNVAATGGTVSMSNSSGSTVSGSGTQAISITGTFAQINADLATLTYTAGSSAGSASISINVWDQVSQQSTQTIGLTVTAAPTNNTTSSITIAPSNANPVEIVNNAAITASAGNHMIFIGGTGDTLIATGGTETVQAFQGHNTITTGAANDTVSFGGNGNVINGGPGSNTLQDSGSSNTIVMPGAGNGFDNIFGYVLQNGDTLDFRAALAGTSWNGSQSTLSKFLHVTMSNNNAIISLSTTSGGSATHVAELQDSGSLSLSGLLAHSIV